jgi:hypothetical protein
MFAGTNVTGESTASAFSFSVFLPTIPISPNRASFLYSVPWVSVTVFLIICPTYFNPEDGSSVFLRNVSVRLED